MTALVGSDTFTQVQEAARMTRNGPGAMALGQAVEARLGSNLSLLSSGHV